MSSPGLNRSALKFDSNGQAMPYYGNTLISFMRDPEQAIVRQALTFQKALAESPLNKHYSFLPPESLHITVFTLCREIDRHTSYWPRDLPQDSPFHEVDRILFERTADVPKPTACRMILDTCEWAKIVLKPYTSADEAQLLDYRRKLMLASGIKHKNYEGFCFHISLNYEVQSLSEDERERRNELSWQWSEKLRAEARPFELPEPEFVIFNDMLAYHRDLAKRGPLF